MDDDIRAELDALQRVVRRAEAGDEDRRHLARVFRASVDAAEFRTKYRVRAFLGSLGAAMDDIYVRAYPLRDVEDLLHVLDTPWPTADREAALRKLLGADRHEIRLEPVVARAIADRDVPLMRVLVGTERRWIGPYHMRDLLVGLHAAGALDSDVVESAFTAYSWLAGKEIPAGCFAALQPYLEDLIWARSEPGADHTGGLPHLVTPRGLRFVRRALDHPDPFVANQLGAAPLTSGERAEFCRDVELRPAEDRMRAFQLRRRAGDSGELLPLLGLGPAKDLLAAVDRAAEDGGVARQDRAAILAAAEVAGPEHTRALLDLVPSELVSAALDLDRAALRKRVKHNALAGIAAYGVLPLAGGETVLDRYVELREIAARGARLGPNRRLSHQAAVEVALEHLAQVAGLADASELEWDCESRLAEAVPEPWSTGAYRVALDTGAEPAITVTSDGRPLRSIPAAVRSDPRYATFRDHQERLRDQARRLRSGVLERLVASGATLEPDAVARLRALPAGGALAGGLLWRDASGAVGLIDDVDATGALTAVHPYHLLETGTLGRWQAEIVRRRVRQPVKQVFRELYPLTPAERAAVDASLRFDGHVVDGRVASRLLSTRGWRTDRGDAARRPAGPLTATLDLEYDGYIAQSTVGLGAVRFRDRAGTVPLADVPPVMFSEVMRDVDLIVSVAGTAGDSAERGESRAHLLAALIDDLGLRRVAVDGAYAVVTGERATYRVHLTSGSIHVEPGGYLCVVPASFGHKPHQRLFLPFADEDPMTGVVLSKVLLLAEDRKITDPVILAQLDRLT